MKKMVWMGCLAAVLNAQAANYDSYTGFACDPVPVLPERELHPSLWFKAGDAAALRGKKEGDARASNLWKQISESEFLTMDFPPVPAAKDDKKTIHEYYGSMSQIAKYAGFMIWMSDGAAEKRKWIDRTAAALQRAYDGPIYSLDPKGKGGPVDEIYLGTWLQNHAAAYDWVQPFLTKKQDSEIRARLARQADWVATNLHRWVGRPHNHLSKPAWGVGSMALALSDDPRALGWLGVALAAANENTRYFFSADGIYREGSQYMVFSWVNFVPFIWNYRNVSGVDQFPDYQPLMEWGVAVRNPKGWLPNIEDSFIRPFPGQMVAAAYRDAPTWLHSSAPLAEVLMWNAETTDMAVFDRYLEKTGFNYTGATWDYTLPLDEYLTFDPSIAPARPDRSPTVFLDGGQGIFRNSWKPNDPSVRYLLFHGVAEADNHNHADQLSFILFAENQMMACDAGYSRKSYSEKIRTQWYNRAEAHNVVTLDGSAPVDAEENRTPLSRYRIDTGFFDFEEKQAPYPNGGLLRRAIAFPGEQYFVVSDIATSPAPAKAVLHLHGGRGRMGGTGASRVWNFSADAYGPACQLNTWTFGADAIENAKGESSYLKGDWGKFPYIKAKASGKEMVFMQILFPTPSAKEAPRVASKKEGNRIWTLVDGGAFLDTLMVQAKPEPATFQGLETDGTFCWVRKEAGRVVQFAVREATYLKKDGTLLFQSLEPATRAVEVAPATLLMDGHVLAESRRRIRAGDPRLAPALSNLLQNAEAAMQAGPFSVMDKSLVPPSGSRHDYMSFGRYWWPDPAKPDGLPYIRRDGETNPGNQGPDNDRVRLDDMVAGVETLGLAYCFTGEQRYAEKAAQLIRTWFLDPETKMNPNLDFAQGIPGRVPGRKTGVLDGRIFSRALDGVALISGSGALKGSERQALHEWFAQYLDWLKTNPNARAESETKNNHSTFFDAQIVHVALFVGDTEYARQVAQAAVEKRILAQIKPDGSQPEELARTRSLHYSLFNLEAMFLLARLADHTGVDLWHAGDSRIRAALDFLAPYANPATPWPYPTIREADRIRLLPLLLYASEVYKEDAYEKGTRRFFTENPGALEWLVVPLMR